MDNQKVILYKNKFEVELKDDTIWLNLNQISDLFGRDKSVISRHLRNIFKDNELSHEATVANFATVQKEGKRTVERNIEYFSLDVIISVGYRVNSKQGTEFRIWATNILRKHLVDGYTLNEKRLKLQEKKYLELKKAIDLIGNVVQIDTISDEAKGLAQVITEYTRALDLLDAFDHETLEIPKGRTRTKYKMSYEQACNVIRTMKEKFNDSDLVGQEKDQSFRSSIGAIYQTFSGKDVYPTIQQKAAHLLYFVTKNHSFVDGNKRIAAALFICFLDGTGILHKKDGSKTIDESALVALTLMIASSNPKDKDMMVKVILNLLN